MITLQALEQGDLVHVSAHRFLVCPVKGDALHSEHLIAVTQDLVDPGRSAFPNHIKSGVNFTVNLRPAISANTDQQ